MNLGEGKKKDKRRKKTGHFLNFGVSQSTASEGGMSEEDCGKEKQIHEAKKKGEEKEGGSKKKKTVGGEGG